MHTAMNTDAMLVKLCDVREAQKEESGLLNDGMTMFEQLMLLNQSRGASMEALASAHLAEVTRLQQEHTAKLNELKCEIETLKREHALQLANERNHHAIEIRNVKHGNAEVVELRATHAAMGPRLRDEILKLKATFEHDHDVKAGMYRDIQTCMSQKQTLYRKLETSIAGEKWAWQLFYAFVVGELGIEEPSQLRELQMKIATRFNACIEARESAQNDVIENAEAEHNMAQIWDTLKAHDTQTAEERIRGLIGVAASGRLQMD